MAEVFGTVSGALSVAALFINCVDCFEDIKLGSHFGRDFEHCQLKLDLAKIRSTILKEIKLLFQTVQKSSKRYDIDARKDDLVRSEDKDMQPVVWELHSRLGVVARQRQKRTGLVEKATWALYDGKNFDRLVEKIRGFVNDLEKLFPVDTTRRKLVELEIEEVDDETSLMALLQLKWRSFHASLVV
ncbi:hypothetical protein J7337_009209 [Fusarium musae]|uniref:Prion-inhibition and propagation HeLo domain-containing protein n=1 Tax=Fusarium musae TaxID=1042133 RepID=A0A9P8DAN3_9HYPO|nr:hypothetical protein J7337_009209 [Fusarium musae]KAG9498404.1 hypothetical protein J7337_009209 [Fusarium musae]